MKACHCSHANMQCRLADTHHACPHPPQPSYHLATVPLRITSVQCHETSDKLCTFSPRSQALEGPFWGLGSHRSSKPPHRRLLYPLQLQQQKNQLEGLCL